MRLTAVVGSRGVGPGTFTHIFADAFPQDAWPSAVVELPAKAGGRPVVVKVRLAED